MLSNSTKYALKAVLFLGVHSGESKKIQARELSEPINVPAAYIAKLMQELARNELVSSKKGPHGGFYLSEENRKVTLRQIVECLDGDYRLTSCMLSLSQCNAEKPCPIHHLVGSIKFDFLEKFSQATIDELVRDIEQNKSFLPL